MAPSTRDRVYQVVSDVLDVPITAINDDSSPDTITAWDSASHINLIMALEAEFGISLSDEDVIDMLSVRLIRMVLEKRGVAGSV